MAPIRLGIKYEIDVVDTMQCLNTYIIMYISHLQVDKLSIKRSPIIQRTHVSTYSDVRRVGPDG